MNMPTRKPKNICIQEGLFRSLQTTSPEDRRAIAELEASFGDEFNLETAESRAWLHRLAEARWNMTKADRMETAVFNRNMPVDDPDPSRAMAKAFLADVNGPNYIEKIMSFREKNERVF